MSFNRPIDVSVVDTQVTRQVPIKSLTWPQVVSPCLRPNPRLPAPRGDIDTKTRTFVIFAGEFYYSAHPTQKTISGRTPYSPTYGETYRWMQLLAKDDGLQAVPKIIMQRRIRDNMRRSAFHSASSQASGWQFKKWSRDKVGNFGHEARFVEV